MECFSGGNNYSNKFHLLYALRCGQGSDSDLFLLQCCAALAPPDLFVMRILERYGLSNYLSLDLERTNEYALCSNFHHVLHFFLAVVFFISGK